MAYRGWLRLESDPNGFAGRLYELVQGPRLARGSHLQQLRPLALTILSVNNIVKMLCLYLNTLIVGLKRCCMLSLTKHCNMVSHQASKTQ